MQTLYQFTVRQYSRKMQLPALSKVIARKQTNSSFVNSISLNSLAATTIRSPIGPIPAV